MRLWWVTLLLVPAVVVFVAARIAIGPIDGTERLDVRPHLPAATSLPTAAIGIATPRPRAVVRVRARPTDVIAGTVVGHIVGSISAPGAFTNPNASGG